MRRPRAEAISEPLRSALLGGRSGTYAWLNDRDRD